MNKKTKKNEKNTHKLLLALMDDLKPTLDRAMVEGKKRKTITHIFQNYKFKEGEVYFTNCFRDLMKLNDMPQRLHLSLILMLKKPTKAVLEEGDIYRSQYIEHNYSNFVFSFVSTLDIALVGVNSIFNLGISFRRINFNFIASNAWVKRFGVDKELKKLEKLVKPFKEDRHDLAHRGEIPKLTNFEDLAFLDAVDHLSKKVKHKGLLEDQKKDVWIKALLEESVDPLKKDILEIEKWIDEFFDQLYPIYQIWKKAPDALRSPKMTVKWK